MPTIDDIKKLRQMTGAGMMDAKKALQESGDDMEKAVDFLCKKGRKSAAKKADERTAAEGLVHAYVHANNKIGALVEVLCETDFVARTEQFQELAHDIALQVASENPLYITREEVPEEVKHKEEDIMKEQLAAESKPAGMVDKIIEGKMNKYYEETVLLEQPFIKDEDKKIADLITDAVAQLGEKIEVRRFCRFEIGTQTQSCG